MPAQSGTARILFSDLIGLAHGRVVPAHLGKAPLHLCMTLMAQAFDGNDELIAGYGVDVGSPDMEALPDADSAVVGWNGEETVSVASLHRLDDDRTAFELDPRGALQRAVAAWSELGLSPVTGFEMEFYLLNGVPVSEAIPVEVPAHRPYGTGLSGDPAGVGQRILEAATRAGLDVAHLSTEFHPGQLEVVLTHTDAVRSADRAFLFRELARETAAEHGLWCTFLGKPTTRFAGSGLHVNLSATDSAGLNAFDEPGETYGLSANARHAAAGVLAHYRALCAFAAPTVNAYKRLVPGSIGHAATWGLDNRLSAIRVSGERGPATRLEFRVPDGTTNPYLVSAALLFAGLLGIRDRLELPPPQLDADTGSATPAPRDLSEALDELVADEELVDLMGADLVRTFVGLKRWEWKCWSESVTDWEIRAYGRHF